MFFSKIMSVSLMVLSATALAMPQGGPMSEVASSIAASAPTSTAAMTEATSPDESTSSGTTLATVATAAPTLANGTTPHIDSISYYPSCYPGPYSVGTCRDRGYSYSCDYYGNLYWHGPTGLYPECYGVASVFYCKCVSNIPSSVCKRDDSDPNDKRTFC